MENRLKIYSFIHFVVESSSSSGLIPLCVTLCQWLIRMLRLDGRSSSEPFSRSVLIKRFLSHLGRTTQGTHSDVSGGIKPSFPATAVGGDDGLT